MQQIKTSINLKVINVKFRQPILSFQMVLVKKTLIIQQNYFLNYSTANKLNPDKRNAWADSFQAHLVCFVEKDLTTWE